VKVIAAPYKGPGTSTTSDGNGDYAIAAPPGEYRLRFVEGNGCVFEALVCVRPGRRSEMNVRLNGTKAGPDPNTCGDLERRIPIHHGRGKGDFPWIKPRGSDVSPSP